MIKGFDVIVWKKSVNSKLDLLIGQKSLSTWVENASKFLSFNSLIRFVGFCVILVQKVLSLDCYLLQFGQKVGWEKG